MENIYLPSFTPFMPGCCPAQISKCTLPFSYSIFYSGGRVCFLPPLLLVLGLVFPTFPYLYRTLRDRVRDNLIYCFPFYLSPFCRMLPGSVLTNTLYKPTHLTNISGIYFNISLVCVHFIQIRYKYCFHFTHLHFIFILISFLPGAARLTDLLWCVLSTHL